MPQHKWVCDLVKYIGFSLTLVKRGMDLLLYAACLSGLYLKGQVSGLVINHVGT